MPQDHAQRVRFRWHQRRRNQEGGGGEKLRSEERDGNWREKGACGKLGVFLCVCVWRGEQSL